MATTVQSIRIAPPSVPASNASSRRTRAGAFAATLQQASRTKNDAPSTSKSEEPKPKAIVVDVDGPVTNKAIGDVVAKAVNQQLPTDPPLDMAPPATNPDDTKPEAVSSDSEKKELPGESKDASNASSTSAAPLAVTYLAPGDARALRCSFPASPLLDVSKSSHPANPAVAKAQQLETPELDKPSPQVGDLVFQLSLKRTSELPPASAGPSVASKEGDQQSPDADDQPRLGSIATETPLPLKVSVSMDPEKTPSKIAATAGNQSRPAPEVASREVSPASAEAMTLLQGNATGQPHNTATSSTEHVATPAATSQPTEPFVPLASHVRAPAALQKMDVILRGTDQIVRLDIRQSSGSVKVSVHSDDAALAVQLRERLPELLNRLDDRGLQAKVTSLGNRSQLPPPARTESGNAAGRDSGGGSRDTAKHQQHQQEHRERNPQRAWRAATWKLYEE